MAGGCSLATGRPPGMSIVVQAADNLAMFTNRSGDRECLVASSQLQHIKFCETLEQTGINMIMLDILVFKKAVSKKVHL